MVTPVAPRPGAAGGDRRLPTVRDADGLAMSSRNVRLDARVRTIAPGRLRGPDACGSRDVWGDGRPQAWRSWGGDGQTAPEIELDYLQMVDPFTLEPVDTEVVRVRGRSWRLR